MVTITHEIFRAAYDVPLTISRGTTTHADLFWLHWAEDGVTGTGEGRAFSVGVVAYTIEQMIAALEAARPWLETASAWDRRTVEARLRAEKAPPPLIAAVNLAHHDWIARRKGVSLRKLWGAPSRPGALNTATIGIGDAAAVRARIARWLEMGDFRAFKVKLGSPAGIAADQVQFEAVRASVPAGSRLSVDANGGWSLADAKTMARWLADFGIDYLEQPLAQGREEELAELHGVCAVPLLIDESCTSAAAVARWAAHIDGVNIKLLKVGGLDAAAAIAATAKAHGLQVLVGCYGESSLGNTAAATLGSYADHFDLDSHLNLAADPYEGLRLEAGRLVLPDHPGIGAVRAAR